jgi:hypothetical protein
MRKRFGSLKTVPAAEVAQSAASLSESAAAAITETPPSRQGLSLQQLMTEGFNDVLRKYGESPIGE